MVFQCRFVQLISLPFRANIGGVGDDRVIMEVVVLSSGRFR